MFILPEHRKKGIGNLLCKRFFGWAKDKGVRSAKVVASVQNDGAIFCYKKNGFIDYNLTLEKDL